MSAGQTMAKRHCAGCRDNFYNGNNDLGVSECWLFRTAKLIRRRRVRMDEAPPWKATPETLPNCYNERGYVFVGPNQER